MNYIDESLSANETIENIFYYHWIVPAMLWVLLISSIIASICLTSYFQGGVGVWSWIVVVFFVYALVSLRYIEQGVTNKRVIYKSGIISRKTNEMKLTSIETVEIDQSVFGRILGYGSVRMTGRGTSDFIFNSIDDPINVKRKVESVISPM